MANPEHLIVVKQGAEAIRRWRKANPQGRFDLTGADLSGVDLSGADLEGADLSSANLRTATLRGADLRDIRSQSGDFRGADLRDVEVDSKTYFGDCDMRECLIDRFTVEFVRERSEWNNSDLLGMKITDGLATLRSSFSGAFMWLHLVGLAGFVLPYLWFCIANWSIAKLQAPEGERVTLLEALGQYIASGGETWGTWQPAPGWILMFTLLLFYNLARLLLLMVTKRLEIQQLASGLPVRFSLRGTWRFWYEFSRIGLWLSLILAAAHTVRFLLHEIPVPNS